jgi:hypothetical protein
MGEEKKSYPLIQYKMMHGALKKNSKKTPAAGR